MRSGVVSSAVTDWPNSDSNGAGNRVYINSTVSGNSWSIGYWHLGTVLVSPGAYVTAGQLIGYTGNTGNVSSPRSNGPHLHLTAKKNNVNVDPEPLLHVEEDGAGNIKSKC